MPTRSIIAAQVQQEFSSSDRPGVAVEQSEGYVGKIMAIFLNFAPSRPEKGRYATYCQNTLKKWFDSGLRPIYKLSVRICCTEGPACVSGINAECKPAVIPDLEWKDRGE
jgi:hypothetical protein